MSTKVFEITKKTIVFTTDSLKIGGKERQISLLFCNINRQQFEPYIISLYGPIAEEFKKQYAIDQDHVFIIGKNSKYQEFSIYRSIIKSLKPKIVISWDNKTSLYGLLSYKILKFKFINASIRHGIRLFRISHFIRSLICLTSPYIIANSFAGLRANTLKPENKRFVFYNGIENKFFNPLSMDEIINKRKQLIPGFSEVSGRVYISVANLVAYKDYFTVLKALHRLTELKSFYYFIIGDGPMRESIVQVIKNYKLENRTFLIGNIENVSDYLFISDLMIHSSRGEGISNAILEGMYAGLPIIATDVGGIPETVYPGSSMLFPYKDEKALLECLLKAPIMFAGFNKESKDYKNHLDKFSVETMLKRFEEIIKYVINDEQ